MSKKEFFGEDLLLGSDSAKEIYGAVKELPVIDYHCHLDQYKIRQDAKFSDIGELCWRATITNGARCACAAWKSTT